MSFALLFAGQGHQHPAMLPWLAEDDMVRLACAQLGVRDWRERLADRAWAYANANAQVLLTGLALAAWQQIATALPLPACVAGYSVGEVAAFSVAGVFDPSSALELAGIRARAMDRCARQSPGGLLGVTGLAAAAIEEICLESGAELALRNGPDTVVVGGPESTLAAAEAAVARRGGRATRLAVGLASHTRWMRPAATEFAQALSRRPLGRPRVALFSDAKGRVHDARQAADALSAQLATTVLWDDCMDDMRARGPRCVLEVGPGAALSRLWNQSYPEVPARACDDFRSASAVVDWIVRACS